MALSLVRGGPGRLNIRITQLTSSYKKNNTDILRCSQVCGKGRDGMTITPMPASPSSLAKR